MWMAIVLLVERDDRFQPRRSRKAMNFSIIKNDVFFFIEAYRSKLVTDYRTGEGRHKYIYIYLKKKLKKKEQVERKRPLD